MLKFLLWALMTASLFADQVTLVNGDRISGKIHKLADGKLAITSAMAGAIVIPWENVAAVASTELLYVVLKDGKARAEPVSRFNKSEITALRSPEEQSAFEKAEQRKRDPHFLDPWTSVVDAGLSATRGNAETTSYTVAFNAVRATPANKLTLGFNSLYARNETIAPMTITANLRRGGARYEMNLSDRQFAFASADAEFDEAQKLDLRTVGGAGFGQHVWKTPRSTVDLFAGATSNRETFATGLRRLSAEALLSEESSHKINSLLLLKQKFAMYPNLTESGEYRFAFDSTVVTTLMRWLSWQVTVSDRRMSDPLPGTVANDLLVTTGFRFNLLAPK